jgi:hypothetical protein
MDRNVGRRILIELAEKHLGPDRVIMYLHLSGVRLADFTDDHLLFHPRLGRTEFELSSPAHRLLRKRPNRWRIHNPIRMLV